LQATLSLSLSDSPQLAQWFVGLHAKLANRPTQFERQQTYCF